MDWSLDGWQACWRIEPCEYFVYSTHASHLFVLNYTQWLEVKYPGGFSATYTMYGHINGHQQERRGSLLLYWKGMIKFNHSSGQSQWFF